MTKTSKKILREVPIIDLVVNYESIKEEIEEVVLNTLSKTNYILGPNVGALENELASYLKCKHVVGCANGTDAIVLALMALGIGAGDEVITVSNSYFATSEAIALVGAKPVFVDIQESDFNIDPSKIEEKITKKTKAILPVHLYGQTCEIEKVVQIARKHSLYVIEDTAQAIGAKYKEKFAGTFGDVGTTSFYPTKNLGCCGDGGAIFTNNDNLAEKLKQLRAHGSPGRYVHKCIGLNSRLDELQAAILRVKLKHLDTWNKARQDAAQYYTKLLSGINGVVTPTIKPSCNHVFHQYTILVKNRDDLAKKLLENGVRTLIYYPIPIHKQEAFSYLKDNYNLPVTEEISQKILSLPMYPELKREDQEYVADCIKDTI